MCSGAGDTAVIWAEPTTSVSISVQRKPAVWTGGGRLCLEEGVCCSSDAFGKLWKETEAHFYSIGLGCVTSFNVLIPVPRPTFVLVSLLCFFVSGNFHSVILGCKIPNHLGIFLIWLTPILLLTGRGSKQRWHWIGGFVFLSRSHSLLACFFTQAPSWLIETCGKATRQKCSTVEKSGNICQSDQKADFRWPNMMSVSEEAAEDTVLSLSLFNPLHYSSSALIIKHGVPSLWSLVSKPESTREAAKPQTLEIPRFLRCFFSGELSN